MADNGDQLNQLWQDQQVELPDIQTFNRQWRKVQLKQRLYAVLDVVGLIIPFIMVMFYSEQMDKFTRGYFIVICLLLCPFVAYIVWLRRFSIGWSSDSTSHHLTRLKRQITNNIKIAYLNKHAIWPIGLLIVLHHLGLFYFDVFPIDKLIRKSLISGGILTVISIFIWIWASRRERRFKKELAGLNRLLS